MPLDNLMDDVQSYDPFNDRAFWDLKFAWLPCRSHESNKIIWLKKAYLGSRSYSGPGSSVVEYRWYTKEEFIMSRLKGTI